MKQLFIISLIVISGATAVSAEIKGEILEQEK